MRLDEQLRQVAEQVPAPPPGDASALFRRGVRRRRLREGVSVAALVAVLGVGVASLIDAPVSPDIADRPPAPAPTEPDNGDGAAQSDGDWHPAGWIVLQAGDLELSVPPQWQVRTIEPAPEPAAQAGPCAYDLYGGIGRSGEQMTSPLAVVYPMETTGVCRLVGLPDAPPEQPSLVLSAGVVPSPQAMVGVRERLGALWMLRADGASREHFVEYRHESTGAGLLVSHVDDPTVQRVLETLRTTSAREGPAGARLPDDGPVIRHAPAATASSIEPFPWAVAVSLGDGGRWCVTAVHGTTEVPDVIGEPCAEFVPPEEDGYWVDIGEYGVQAAEASSETPSQRLAWGFGRGVTDQVVVEFTDGSRDDAVLAAARPTIDATLWAIGYEDVEVQGAEASSVDGRGTAGIHIHHRRFPAAIALGAASIIVILAALARALSRRRGTGDRDAPVF